MRGTDAFGQWRKFHGAKDDSHLLYAATLREALTGRLRYELADQRLPFRPNHLGSAVFGIISFRQKRIVPIRKCMATIHASYLGSPSSQLSMKLRMFAFDLLPNRCSACVIWSTWS